MILHHNRDACAPFDLALAQNAYFHAAVGFTVNELKKGDYSGYITAVDRFWKTRMDNLDVDLVSEKLLKWKEFMIRGVEDYIVRETMLMKWNEKEGRDAILMFNLAVIDAMEPHSLELAATKMMTMNESNVNDIEGADDLGLNSCVENNGDNRTVDKSDALVGDNMELGGDGSSALPKNSISTAEVEKVTCNLKRSREDLKKVVQDPLPVIVLALTSAHSEVDSDNSADHASKKVQLPIPQRFKVSPLETIKSAQLPRKGKRWSDEEVNALREGVVEYGGKWRTIKNSYPGVLKDKSLKALRQKWGYMTSRS